MINVGAHHGTQQTSNQPDCSNYLRSLCAACHCTLAPQGLTRSSKPHCSRGGVCSTPARAYKTLQDCVGKRVLPVNLIPQIIQVAASNCFLHSVSSDTDPMGYTMGDVLGSEKKSFSEHMGTTSTTTSLQTPPRTPTLSATAAQTVASEIRDIHYALSELSDLKPGQKINSLLTRLVSLCVEPYSTEFVNYFFNLEGMSKLCEKLRPLCAAAEGELERFWASKIINDSMESQGNSNTTV